MFVGPFFLLIHLFVFQSCLSSFSLLFRSLNGAVGPEGESRNLPAIPAVVH